MSQHSGIDLAEPGKDFAVVQFKCGCCFDSRRAEWLMTCRQHQDRPSDCYCLNTGTDDGAMTCFDHHDCSLGYCTHRE